MKEKLISGDGKINIIVLLKISLKRKYIYAITSILAILFSLLYLSFDQPLYTARMFIRVVDQDDKLFSANKLSLRVNPFARGASTDIAFYMTSMRSMDVIGQAVAKHNLAQLLQPHLWNSKTGEWHRPTGLRSDIRNFLSELLGRPPRLEPDDPLVVAAILGKIVSIQSSGGYSGRSIYRVTVSFKQPQAALDILSILHEETMKKMQKASINNVENILHILRESYNKETNSEIREGLLDDIIYTEKRLLTISDPHFSIIEVVDKPSFPMEPKMSSPGIIISLGIISGIIIGIIINIFLYYLKIVRGRHEYFYMKES